MATINSQLFKMKRILPFFKEFLVSNYFQKNHKVSKNHYSGSLIASGTAES